MDIGLLAAYLGFLAVIIYLLVIMPQRRRMRAQSEMFHSLQPGDRVLTVGGIFGTVSNVDDEAVELEISKGVKIKVAGRAIGQKLPEAELSHAEPVE